ncbi:MAG: type II toxin-antitoxin system VapB family antitoxin [Alphaproteobacteria bacterium]|nr:type II toxin-antitoxin system VapB family antitoxin [Alphaproteobacteria bacterium]
MRTNVVIDDALMDKALKVSGLKTKRQAIEEGLRLLVRTRQQSKIRRLRGALEWDGSLDDMRRDR